MNAVHHKIIGLLVFFILFLTKLLPDSMLLFMNSFARIILSLFLVSLFTGGRITNKNWFSFGLSPDNDYHKKMKRTWFFHSPLLPLIAVLLFSHPLVLISSFGYALHVFLDLFNNRSWKGSKNTYFAVFFSTILFFVVLYK